ncbi:MAG: hypothetical protein PHV93_03775 [Candidatus Pacebacteria bacterium]|nr:hypothetical protein [Candidatus Paceibacterota bacterium]
MEQIKYNGECIGVLLTSLPDGSKPLTDGKEALQVVTLKHKAGSVLKAHMHEPKRRETQGLQECLFVKSGRVALDLFWIDKTFVKKIELKAGDFFILQKGGIAITIIENAELIEAKNGPFVEDKILI